MASFEILLISVRSETPTSFFLVVSKTAFFVNPAFGPPPAACLEPPASFLRPARFVTAYTDTWSAPVFIARRIRSGPTMVDAQTRAQVAGVVSRNRVRQSVQ